MHCKRKVYLLSFVYNPLLFYSVTDGQSSFPLLFGKQNNKKKIPEEGTVKTAFQSVVAVNDSNEKYSSGNWRGASLILLSFGPSLFLGVGDYWVVQRSSWTV